jgi:hypothetical protein
VWLVLLLVRLLDWQSAPCEPDGMINVSISGRAGEIVNVAKAKSPALS